MLYCFAVNCSHITENNANLQELRSQPSYLGHKRSDTWLSDQCSVSVEPMRPLGWDSELFRVGSDCSRLSFESPVSGWSDSASSLLCLSLLSGSAPTWRRPELFTTNPSHSLNRGRQSSSEHSRPTPRDTVPPALNGRINHTRINANKPNRPSEPICRR